MRALMAIPLGDDAHLIAEDCGICRLCHLPLITPVTLACGHAFCRDCVGPLLANFTRAPACPVDGAPISRALPAASRVLAASGDNAPLIAEDALVRASMDCEAGEAIPASPCAASARAAAGDNDGDGDVAAFGAARTVVSAEAAAEAASSSSASSSSAGAAAAAAAAARREAVALALAALARDEAAATALAAARSTGAAAATAHDVVLSSDDAGAQLAAAASGSCGGEPASSRGRSGRRFLEVAAVSIGCHTAKLWRWH